MVTTKVIFVIIFGIILLVLLVLLVLQLGKFYEEEYGIEALFENFTNAISELFKKFFGG